jgi:hypothetical protein
LSLRDADAADRIDLNMRLRCLIPLLLLAACHKPSSSESPKLNPPAAPVEVSTCISRTERDQLTKEPVSNASAWRLSRHYGICASDAAGEEKWLKYLAERGDVEAMTELSTLLRYLPGRSAEAIHWQEEATRAVRSGKSERR